MNIYPQEIENALKSDLRVRELYVCGQNDDKLGMQIVLNVVGDFYDTSEVKEMCNNLLPSYQIPNKINIVKELPKNGSGKIIRRQEYA
jgi:acyl-CoA synthetase (AMP-forming)/AMP-acid ligase II